MTKSSNGGGTKNENVTMSLVRILAGSLPFENIIERRKRNLGVQIVAKHSTASVAIGLDLA